MKLRPGIIQDSNLDGQIQGNEQYLARSTQFQENEELKKYEFFIESLNIDIPLDRQVKLTKKICLKVRRGKYYQSLLQRILNGAKNSHICKDLPRAILQCLLSLSLSRNLQKKVLNALGPLAKKKALSHAGISLLISRGKLSLKDWEKILNEKDVCDRIDNSKRIGHYRAVQKRFQFGRDLLVHMGKQAQKIVFRSAKRKILTAVGQKTNLTQGFLDNRAQRDLWRLDIDLGTEEKYQRDFKEYVSLIALNGKKTQ